MNEPKVSSSQGRRTVRPSRTRHFVWSWYLPILIVIGMGLFVSLDQSGTTGRIVDRARTFQDQQEANRSFDTILTQDYQLEVELNEQFVLKDGDKVVAKGSFREGDQLEIPLSISGVPGMLLGEPRIEFTNGERAPLLPAFEVGARSCETPWVKSEPTKKTIGKHRCMGPNTVRIGTTELTGDTMAVLPTGESLSETDKLHLLLKVSTKDGAILPVKGYESKLRLTVTGLISGDMEGRPNVPTVPAPIK